MRRAWRSVATLVLITPAACAPPAPVLPSPAAALPDRLSVQVVERGRPVVRSVALEEYVRAVMISEFAPAGGDAELVERVLHVQAIITRTYAVANLRRHRAEGFDVCATTHCQLFEPARLRSSRWAPAAAAAASRTAHTLLWHDGRPARTVYHADCGGHTSSAFDVWGGDNPRYLGARADDGAAGSAHTAWVYTATLDPLLRALNADARTRVGNRLRAIEITRRDRAGRAAQVTLRGQRDVVVRGDELRQVLSSAFGARAIRSTLFDVRREAAGFHFAGRGFGHGVGLCQAGALARLRAGWEPEQVLAHYFPGTTTIGPRGVR